jgi:hypothetical protein
MNQPNDTPEPSLASAGYAVEWEPNVGDSVRVKDPDSFLPPLDKKLRDRDGVVVRKWIPMGRARYRAVVRFGKRNGRGKEFEGSFSINDLMPWPKKDA